MLTDVVSGLLCGNRGYKATAEWLHDLPVDVWHWMGDTRRTPKQGCFRDLLVQLDPEVLESALSRWIDDVLELELTDDDLAAVSNAGLNVLRQLETENLTATLRSFTQKPLRLLRTLGYPN